MIGDRSQFMGERHGRCRLANSVSNDDVNGDLRWDDRGVEEMTDRAIFRRLQVLVMMPELRR